MTEQKTFGQIVVSGTAADLELATVAFAGQLQPVVVQDLEPRTFNVKFLSAQEMYDRGAIIPGSRKTVRYPLGQPAYGFALWGVLLINRERLPREQKYALRHEPFHPIIAANMTAPKRLSLLPLVERVASDNPYQNRLSEVLCDAFVELFWGRGSLADDYYGEISDADLQEAFDILMKPRSNEPTVPVEPPVPLPMPDPRDEQIADLTQQLVDSEEMLAEAQDVIEAVKVAVA